MSLCYCLCKKNIDFMHILYIYQYRVNKKFQYISRSIRKTSPKTFSAAESQWFSPTNVNSAIWATFTPEATHTKQFAPLLSNTMIIKCWDFSYPIKFLFWKHLTNKAFIDKLETLEELKQDIHENMQKPSTKHLSNWDWKVEKGEKERKRWWKGKIATT